MSPQPSHTQREYRDAQRFLQSAYDVIDEKPVSMRHKLNAYAGLSVAEAAAADAFMEEKGASMGAVTCLKPRRTWSP